MFLLKKRLLLSEGILYVLQVDPYVADNPEHLLPDLVSHYASCLCVGVDLGLRRASLEPTKPQGGRPCDPDQSSWVRIRALFSRPDVHLWALEVDHRPLTMRHRSPSLRLSSHEDRSTSGDPLSISGSDAGGPRSPHKTKGHPYPHAEPPEVWVIPVVIWISRELMMIAPRAAAHHTIRSGCAVWSFPHMVPSPGENRGSCRGGRARWRSDPPTGSTWRG